MIEVQILENNFNTSVIEQTNKCLNVTDKMFKYLQTFVTDKSLNVSILFLSKLLHYLNI